MVKFPYWGVLCLIMQPNPYRETDFYTNIRDEFACINKYVPARKLSPKNFNYKPLPLIVPHVSCGIKTVCSNYWHQLCLNQSVFINREIRVSFLLENQNLSLVNALVKWMDQSGAMSDKALIDQGWKASDNTCSICM